MNTKPLTIANIADIQLEADGVRLTTKQGATAFEAFADYPRLAKASTKERAAYETSEFGLHWPALDEDLSFDGFFKDKQEATPLKAFFAAHDTINVSALARRLNIPQSLFAAYVSGKKRLTAKRKEEITAAIRAIGKELSAATI